MFTTPKLEDLLPQITRGNTRGNTKGNTKGNTLVNTLVNITGKYYRQYQG
jgi:hypothetical protein